MAQTQTERRGHTARGAGRNCRERLEQGCRAHLPTHPGEPEVSLGLSINTNRQVISFRTLPGCNHKVHHTPGDSCPLSRVEDSAASPTPFAAFNPYTSSTRGRRGQRGVVWCPNGCSSPLEDKTCPATHPFLHPSPTSERRCPAVGPRQVCEEGGGKSQLLGHQHRKHHGQRV